MRLGFCLAILVLTTSFASAQTSADWQQRVRYEMEITLHPERHQFDGRQRLTYYNHSPDTLREVFYHLYFNAFQPTSMMAERNRHLPDPDGRVVPRIFNLGPDEIGYQDVHSLQQDGQPLTFRITDTVLQAELATPLAPGDSTVLTMQFQAQVPLQTRRSGRDNAEGIAFSMSQWYPKLAQYDATGWHADPYIGREFYAPFGTFDVRLRLPAPYVVGATGVLQNPEAIGHGYQADSTAVYTYADTDTLAWHFVAEDVHDFAWVADPDYIHRKLEGDALTLHFLYQPDVATNWQALIDWTPSLFQAFAEIVGPYPYPQFTVAQAGDGGMEYPMMTFITGRRAVGSLRSVTAHEAAHEWFHTVLASNEADYAWMDEGFANFLQNEGQARLRGQWRGNHFSALYSVVAAQTLGFYERPNTPSDWFTRNAAYGIGAYSSGQALAETMAYVISDSLRNAWLRTYFERFAFKHPNPWDVQKVAEDVSGVRLDWFFDQWTNTEHTLDYAVAAVDSRRTGNEWQHAITLRREAPFVLPVDVLITFEDGTSQWVNVPLGIMQGHKPVPEGWIVAEPWLWTFPEYTLELTTSARIDDVQIDPLVRTPDVNRLNNARRFPRTAQFLRPAQPNWLRYGIGWRPLADYAYDFGPGVGLRAEGGYIFGKHTTRAMLKLWPQALFNEPEPSPAVADFSAWDGVDYALSYRTPLPALGRNAQIGVSLSKHLGILENRLAVTQALQPFGASTSHTLTVAVNHQYNPTDRVFELDGLNWFLEENMLSAMIGYRAARGRNYLSTMLEMGASFRNLLECRDEANDPAACLFEFRQGATRLLVDGSRSIERGRLRGTASFNLGLGVENLAFHKRFRLGAPSVEDVWRNAASRALVAAFENPLADHHLTAFGTAGPVGYLLSATQDDLAQRPAGGTPVGTSALAGSLSLSTAVWPQNQWIRPLRVEAFSGIGTTWGGSTFGTPGEDTIPLRAENLVADAGVGASYDLAQLAPLRRWTAQSDVLSGLHLTAKFPLWLSDPALIGETEAVAFRWLLGVTVQPQLP